MFDREGARRIAEGTLTSEFVLDEERVRETREGWYFPYRPVVDLREVPIGATGVIVNKHTGKVRILGSGSEVLHSLDLYDRGYQFDRYDLVILEISNARETLDVLFQLWLTLVEPFYEHGTVWRIPRELTRAEIKERISRLPCVFANQSLNFLEDVLERARAAGHFRFETLEFRAGRF